jgi:hypothetical protein
MAHTPKVLRRVKMGYIPQINDSHIGHLPKKRQKQIVLKAAAKRKQKRLLGLTGFDS